MLPCACRSKGKKKMAKSKMGKMYYVGMVRVRMHCCQPSFGGKARPGRCGDGPAGRGLSRLAGMFVRRLAVERVDAAGTREACLLKWIDSFAMRNFTNDAIFDDTLPAGDGLLEAGLRVPLDQLAVAMEDWFRRKGYLKAGERLEVRELQRAVDSPSGD
jgi:hypothetical protein